MEVRLRAERLPQLQGRDLLHLLVVLVGALLAFLFYLVGHTSPETYDISLDKLIIAISLRKVIYQIPPETLAKSPEA